MSLRELIEGRISYKENTVVKQGYPTNRTADELISFQ
jgi:hypothetical protein